MKKEVLELRTYFQKEKSRYVWIFCGPKQNPAKSAQGQDKFTDELLQGAKGHMLQTVFHEHLRAQT